MSDSLALEAGVQGSPERAEAYSDIAGHAQKALVAKLQQCSHAVVIVDRIDALPTAVLPVLINALSERGHFWQDGQEIDTTKAMFIATMHVPPGLLQQVCQAKCMLHYVHVIFSSTATCTHV